MNIHKDLKNLLHKYNKCFTKSEQKFLNEKYFKISNFYGLPKLSLTVEVWEPSDLKLRPNIGMSDCPTRRHTYF